MPKQVFFVVTSRTGLYLTKSGRWFAFEDFKHAPLFSQEDVAGAIREGKGWTGEAYLLHPAHKEGGFTVSDSEEPPLYFLNCVREVHMEDRAARTAAQVFAEGSD